MFLKGEPINEIVAKTSLSSGVFKITTPYTKLVFAHAHVSCHTCCL